MRIKRMHVKNFKSIKEMEIEFSSLTMLVGANASGKSNIINVFRFISNCMTFGVDNAISLQGGMPYLANVCLDKKTPIEIEFEIDFSDDDWVRMPAQNDELEESIGLLLKDIKYSFAIKPNNKGFGYSIAYDNVELNFECLDTEIEAATFEGMSIGATYNLSFSRKSSRSKVVMNRDVKANSKIKEYLAKSLETRAERFFNYRINENENKKELMLRNIPILLPPTFNEDFFIKIFDFNPKVLKKPSSMASKNELEEDGSNIAKVLDAILRNKESKKELKAIMKDFLPFVESIDIEKNFDMSFYFSMTENFSKNSFPANYLSDGTVSVLALVISLFFERYDSITILEEPERNIHPRLIAKLIHAAREASSQRQVIITTHNPEFLRQALIEEVRFVKREEGFTVVCVPQNSETVKQFLENDLGLDDLFLQDLLGG